MKAADYAKKYLEYKENPPDVWSDHHRGEPDVDALVSICLDLLQEARELIKTRHAASGTAMEGVLRELNQKFLAMRRKLPNEPIPEGAFKYVVIDKWPQAANLVARWPGRIDYSDAPSE
jgi:hypothetical protein